MQNTQKYNFKLKKKSIAIIMLLLMFAGCTKNNIKATPNKIKYRRWSMIGCHIADTYNGIKVVSINRNSAAEKGGLLLKDIVLELNDKVGANTTALIRTIRESLPQTKIKLKINRNGNEKVILLTTVAYPLEPQLKKMIIGANKSGDFLRALELIKEYDRRITTDAQSGRIAELKKKLLGTLGATTNQQY